eukprot:SAG31_NODE_14015_length_831_cov_2.293716_1_plen_223_part_10
MNNITLFCCIATMAPPSMHVRFLMLTLTGNTRFLFRRHFASKPSLTYEQAKQWLRDNCTSRDFRQKLQREMDTLSMKNSETIQVFLAHADTLRQKLARNNINTDDFHYRERLEATLKRRPAAFSVLCDVLKEPGALEQSLKNFQERLRTVAHAHDIVPRSDEKKLRLAGATQSKRKRNGKKGNQLQHTYHNTQLNAMEIGSDIEGVWRLAINILNKYKNFLVA